MGRLGWGLSTQLPADPQAAGPQVHVKKWDYSLLLPTHAYLQGPSALYMACSSSQPDSIVSKQMQVERLSLDREQTTSHEIQTES